MTAQNEELGPLLVAPAIYLELRSALRDALGFPNERRPLLVGIDGADGAGKSSLAAWLSWQLEMPVINLDLYIIRNTDPLSFLFDDIARMIGSWQAMDRPIIVEGALLLEVLSKVGRSPDFLVFIDKDDHHSTMTKHVLPYMAKRSPREKANFVLEWSSVERDQRLLASAILAHR